MFCGFMGFRVLGLRVEGFEVLGVCGEASITVYLGFSSALHSSCQRFTQVYVLKCVIWVVWGFTVLYWAYVFLGKGYIHALDGLLDPQC